MPEPVVVHHHRAVVADTATTHRLHEGLRVRQRVPTAFARGRGEVVVEIDVRRSRHVAALELLKARGPAHPVAHVEDGRAGRSAEHTSELQSLMRNSYAVFCLNNKTNK